MTTESKSVDSRRMNDPNCAVNVERAVAALPDVYVEKTGIDAREITFAGHRIDSTCPAATDGGDRSHNGCCDDEQTESQTDRVPF